MKSYCKYSIGNKIIREASDNRISVEDQELWINNFGQDNFEKSVEVKMCIRDRLILDTATVFMYTDRPKISSFLSLIHI